MEENPNVPLDAPEFPAYDADNVETLNVHARRQRNSKVAKGILLLFAALALALAVVSYLSKHGS